MAELSTQHATIGGAVLTFTPAAASGDGIRGGDRTVLLVNNGSASAVTVTVVTPGNTEYGQPEPDVPSVSIPAAGVAVIGPLPRKLADPSDGLVHVTYSAATSVTVAVAAL